ncbi:MAG: UDP-N-acetylmuramate--L-alanine ligase [Candidatus Coatesbacteria bacterium]
MKKIQRVHMIGIGGSGMCGIAEILLTLGYKVSGSDLKLTDVTERLKNRGARIAQGHQAGHVGDAQVVVYSSAVDPANPEVVEARRRGVPLIRRAEMLAELMRLKYGVAVAGTHGKTTTTSMAGLVLTEAGLDPTVIIGGRLNNLGSHARPGEGEYLVAEADESDGSFLCLNPVIAVITNIDNDHLDHYRSIQRLQAAFVEFAHKVPFWGSVIVCADDPGVRQILPELRRRVVTYGLGTGAALRAEGLRLSGAGSVFRVVHEDRVLGELALTVPGRHNVLNALGAVGVGLELEVPFDRIARALAAFTGVARRLQLKGEARGVRVYDDYGHHPTEILATAEAARLLADQGKLWLLFQPHRFTRTNLLRDSFGPAFEPADGVILTEIYAAGESPIPGVTGRIVLDAVRAHGRPEVEFVPELAAACETVARRAKPGDVIVTLGAGDVGKMGDKILRLLEGIAA